MVSKPLYSCVALLCVVISAASSAVDAPAEAAQAFEQAEAYYAEAAYAMSVPLYRQAMQEPRYHVAAYGRLVQMGIRNQDQAALQQLFSSHRAYLLEAPEDIRQHLQLFDMLGLRRTYNEALRAEIARDHDTAEKGFARLLGDEAFHRQATFWLFRLAMQQKDFKRARFIANLGRLYPAEAATSPELLAACALQRDGEREQAMAQLAALLTERGAYQGDAAARVDAQRAVYLAVIRLHEEHDQCFLHAWNTPEEARVYFPTLSDEVLRYMAR